MGKGKRLAEQKALQREHNVVEASKTIADKPMKPRYDAEKQPDNAVADVKLPKENTGKTKSSTSMSKKPPLAKIYDKIFPPKKAPSYTREQDLIHSGIIFAIIAVLLSILSWTWWCWTTHQQYIRSAELRIPREAYVLGQEQNVTSTLSSDGFIDITTDEDGDIIGFGTPEMVSSYQESYKERTLNLVKDYLTKDYSSLGIGAISVSDDSRKITFDVGVSSLTSSELTTMFSDTKIADLITAYGKWCPMINDGDKLTVSFTNIVSNEEIWSVQASTPSEIISKMEAKESNSENSDTQTDSISNTNEKTASNASDAS